MAHLYEEGLSVQRGGGLRTEESRTEDRGVGCVAARGQARRIVLRWCCRSKEARGHGFEGPRTKDRGMGCVAARGQARRIFLRWFCRSKEARGQGPRNQGPRTKEWDALLRVDRRDAFF